MTEFVTIIANEQVVSCSLYRLIGPRVGSRSRETSVFAATTRSLTTSATARTCQSYDQGPQLRFLACQFQQMQSQ